MSQEPPRVPIVIDGLDKISNEPQERSTVVVRGGLRRWAILALVFLGAAPLPVIICAVAAYLATRGLLGGTSNRQLLLSQLLLVLTVLLVASAGAFMMWHAAGSLAGTTDGAEAAIAPRGGLTGAMTDSVSHMLTTIQRQGIEIEQLGERLRSANLELESARARLREISFTDDVTGLGDQRFLLARLENEVARCRRFGHPLSLVLVDLDDVPGVDGELLSDAAREASVREVAQVLLKCSRSIDVVSRHDGGGFAVLLVETPLDGARAYAERMAGTLSGASWSHGGQLTASFGLCSLPHGAAAGDDLLRGAEEALEAARRTGANRIAVWAGGGATRWAGCEVSS
jgi:diguanylate cyclase (GGDEF)-like protein